MTELNNIIKSKINNTSNENKKLANEKCSAAKECLRKVETAEPNDKKNFLLEAYDLYLEAVEFNSKLVDAFHGLAFICYSLSQKREAVLFLHNALNVDPDNEYTKELLEEIKNDVRKSALSGIISKHAGKSLSDSISSVKEDRSASIFSKFTSIFAAKVIKKSSSRGSAANISAINHANVNNATATTAPGKGGGDYLSMIREAKNQIKK